MRVLIATTNPDKVREIHQAIGHLPITLLTLSDFPCVASPLETGTSFEANARLKALHYDKTVAASEDDIYTVAEDSGLVIDALDGAPGVESARFLRPDATYPERFAEIYRLLASCSAADNKARFVCALAVARRERVVFETTGTVEGEIASGPRGRHGFGYDPIFYYPPYGRTLGEVTQAEKDAVSHRDAAFRRLATWLGQQPQNQKQGM